MTERLLDREAVGRVLRRAGDLVDDEQESLLQLGNVSEGALVEAAAEVGIPAAAVRRALAIERLDPSPGPRASDRLVGAVSITVDAEVAGSSSDVLARLDAWLVEGHHLRRDRLRAGRGMWSKRRGVFGRTVRTLRLATGEGRLGRARRVNACACDTGIGTTVVRVEVDRSRPRRMTAAGAAAAGAATASTFVLAAIAGPVLLVATPIGVLAGVGLAASARSRDDAVGGEVERLLDAVDDRVAPMRLRADLARRAVGRPRRSAV